MPDLTRDLRAVLDRYPAAARPMAAPEPLGNAGGLSGARLWRFEAGRGRLVTRAWPTAGPDGDRLDRIHHWLAAAGHLLFVPVPLPALDGRTWQAQGGRLWEVAPWLPGAPDLGRPPDPARLRSGFAALAALHRAWEPERTTGASPGLARRLAEIDAWLRGGFDDLDRALDRAGPDPCREPARRWLDLARRLAPRVGESIRPAAASILDLQPCLRDVRGEHLLFEGDRLTGLVDFGAMGVDAVAGDLARLLDDWVGPDPKARSEGLTAYAAIRPLDAAEHAAITAFEAGTALLLGGHWARWHFREGRAFDRPDAVPLGLARGLDRLSNFDIKL
ncbi:MAG TPA: phosphotransferase [Isosphaeraceae bacterium]|jgi:homoserine kinase type II|nr:phosphotransferase [Isosphaeraceae bacterium]